MLALAAIVSLSGCSGGNKDAVSNASGYPGAEVKLNGDDIYPIECEDTITWWKDMSDLGTTFENFGDTPIAKKLSEETGVKVEYIHPVQGQGAEQIQLLIASDELPDLVKHSWNTYPGGPEMAIADEYIYDIGDLIDKFAPALKKMLSEKKEWDKQIKTDSGKYYSVPMFLEPGLLQICYGPVLRGDLLEKLKLEAPTTIEEWEKVLRAFKENGVQYPYMGDFNQMLDTFASGFGFYKEWYHDNGEIKYGYSQPGYKEFLMTLNRWYEEGLIHPDFLTLDTTKIQSEMLNGKAGSSSFWAGSGMGPLLKAAEEFGEYSFKGVQFPAEEKGKNAEYNYITAQVLMGSGTAISKNCKNPELAMRLIDYAFTEEGKMLSSFGIEGVSYNMVEGYPKYTDIIHNNPDEYTVSQAIAAYTLNGHIPMLQDVRYIEQYYTQPELSAAQREWNKTNMNDHIVPQLYVKEEESAKSADIMVNVNTYAQEMAIKFITGRESFDKYDDYLKQLETFGLGEAVAFQQDAFDRYNKR